jgi:hypothetical protein
MKKEIKVIEEVRKSAQFEIKRELFYWGSSDIDMLAATLWRQC